MFCFIPVTGTKQKLGEEKLLQNWTFVSTTLKSLMLSSQIVCTNLNYSHIIKVVCVVNNYGQLVLFMFFK